MKDLIFTFMLGSGEEVRDALRLARSIRTFGGELSFNPIWMLSRRSEDELPEETRQELYAVGARLIGYDMDPEEAKFPFAAYVMAASLAEGLAQGESSFLAVMATDTLIVQPPTRLILPGGKSLGCCPVHLKLLGSGYNLAVDEYWGLVYRACRVQEERIFNVQTVVDEQDVRAYFNSGLLVVRPERGLLRAWKAEFDRLSHLPEFEAFYQQDELYRIFMHQAVLAGCILSSLKQEEIEIYPAEVNYPLHLQARLSLERRPRDLSQLITCRYEEFAATFGDPEVKRLVTAEAWSKIGG